MVDGKGTKQCHLGVQVNIYTYIEGRCQRKRDKKKKATLLQCSLLTLDGNKVLSCNYISITLFNQGKNTFNVCNSKKQGYYFLIITQLILFLNYYFQMGIKRVTCIDF